MRLLRYFARLSPGKTILWCYLVWYLAIVSRIFDPAPAIWLNSIGLSAIIGLALLLSFRTPGARPDRWQLFRTFLTPFCVSSFAALIKGRGFVLVFPPGGIDLAIPVVAVAAFLLGVGVLRAWLRDDRPQPAALAGTSARTRP